ncbi:MAG: hypothetical protein IPM69_07150 [Ignavibacteria bacterium]|nr:hypothetical protein [Ignavibacteria bacterium]
MKIHVLFVIYFFSGFLFSSAQDNDSGRVYVLFPQEAVPYSFSGSIGATTTFVPRPIAEEEIRQIPILDANFRYNLPVNFALTGRLGSNYITNLASIGAMWSISYRRFSLSFGDYSTLWYGFATMENSFDVSAIGWLNTPHVSFGIAFDEVLISVRGELLYITSRSTRVGDIEIASEKNVVAGGSFGIYTEQPFFRNTHLLLGLKINNLSNAYQSWLAFSTFNDRLTYPEFMIGILL